MALPAHSCKRNPKILIALGFLLILFLPGCSVPPLPPEVGLVERMNHDLWKAQAHVYTPEEYKSYEATLKNIMNDLIREEARLIWFRNDEPISERLKAVLSDGEGILKKAQERKEAKRIDTARQLSELEEKLIHLDRLSFTINEGRLTRRDLTKASLLIREAGFSIEREDYDGALSRLTRASGHIRASEGVLFSILDRYMDKTLIEKWKKWSDEVIAESQGKRTTAIVVSKMERRLTLYQLGKPVRTYEIGIGRNGLANKRLAGDGATPEGSYRIVKKLTKSRYHKALLLNYPNEEDRREFLRLKKRGFIARKAGMGGLIEIHGGGKEGMTFGCVSLENRDMDEVFELIPLGTSVAIVGTTSPKDGISVTKKVGDD